MGQIQPDALIVATVIAATGRWPLVINGAGAGTLGHVGAITGGVMFNQVGLAEIPGPTIPSRTSCLERAKGNRQQLAWHR